MLLARVCGKTHSTVRHPSLAGAKLLLAQPLRSQTLEPVVVVDRLGATAGDLVMISSDGQFTREVLGDTTSPVRWTVVSVVEAATERTALAHLTLDDPKVDPTRRKEAAGA